MPGARWVAIAAVAVSFAGCGSDTPDPPRLSEAQALTLLAPLAEARAAATSHDVALTEQAMSLFRARVARLRREGALTDETARALRVGAARVLARVRTDNPPTAITTTPAPAPEPAGKEKEKKKKGHGKKKGKKE